MELSRPYKFPIDGIERRVVRYTCILALFLLLFDPPFLIMGIRFCVRRGILRWIF